MDLVIAHVSKDYGRGPVLRDVSLTVRQGETVCLMGPSGLGKTTLLRCVAGLETPDAGAVTGVPRRLGYVFQEDRLCDNFSAVANIRLVTGRTLPEKAILQHLEELGLSDSVRLPVSQLSGGMRRRVAIARAVCCGPELLLLDEAFSKMTSDRIRPMMELFRRLQLQVLLISTVEKSTAIQPYCDITYSIVRHGDANAIAPFYRAGTLADAPEKETEYE